MLTREQMKKIIGGGDYQKCSLGCGNNVWYDSDGSAPCEFSTTSWSDMQGHSYEQDCMTSGNTQACCDVRDVTPPILG